MAISTDVRAHFDEDPESAFRWVEGQLYDRVRHVYRVFEALFELIDDTVKVDPHRAKDWGLKTLALLDLASFKYHRPRQEEDGCDWSILKPMAFAVLASCYTKCQQEDLALSILNRLRRWPQLPEGLRGSVFARLAIALLELGRVAEAEAWADRAVQLLAKKQTGARPFRCLPMALVVRGAVGIYSYERAEVEASRLFSAAEDGTRAAPIARELAEGTFLLADRRGYEDLRTAALHNVARASALAAFAGVSIELVDYPTVKRESAHWPKARWIDALCGCADSEQSPELVQRAFHEARDGFEERGLVDELVQVTVDLQWWLIARGELRQAAAESEWLRYHLDAMRFDRQVVEQWITALERREVSSEVIATVFREVRGLHRVPSPVRPGAICGSCKDVLAPR